jgi:hypothetical protein
VILAILLINWWTLYEFISKRLLGETILVDEKTLLLGAHKEAQEEHSAPLLGFKDLTDLSHTLRGMREKTLAGHGLFPRRFEINEKLVLLTDIPLLTRWF